MAPLCSLRLCVSASWRENVSRKGAKSQSNAKSFAKYRLEQCCLRRFIIRLDRFNQTRINVDQLRWSGHALFL